MIRARSLLERLPRAILFLDVVESTRLIEVDEEGVVHRWLDVVEKLKAGPIAKHGETRLVKVLGDGLLMEAENANVAVSLAQDLLAAFDAESDDPDSLLQVRIGINVGEVIRSVDDDIYGNDVNIAFRLLSVAQPGEIVATAQVRDALSDELDAGFEDLGECYLRNVVRPVRVFRVHPKGWTRRVRANLTDADLMPTVAVIPFAQRNPAVDHFALGEVLADAMISTLARSADINVISGLSTTRFRMREATLTEIGTALAADFVITGIYSSDGQHATLDVEMTEVRTGVVVWSERLVEKVADLVQPQNPIQALVSRAHSAILKRETDRALTSRMPTLESYALLMGAVSLMHRLTLHEFELAGQMLDTLMERAPRQPAPLSAMARWHVLRVVQGWTEAPDREAQMALSCTRRALDLDASHVPAMVAEGFVLNNLLRKLDAAEQIYNDALDLSPNDAHGRLLRGTLYAFRGEGKAATRDTERALHLAPLDPHRFFFQSLAASACLANDDFERAHWLASNSMRMNRMHTSTLRVKAVAEHRLGRTEAARETAEELMRLQPNLTVSGWLASAPSADFPVGQAFARTLKEIGVPP